MAKLFSPLIEPIIPSFYKDAQSKVNINIPFTMNQAVSKREIIGFVVKVKNVQSSTYLFERKINNINSLNTVSFNLNPQEEFKLKVGLFYKFQIAYIDLKGDVGYYSTVGIGKYTTEPEVSIAGLEKNIINNNLHSFKGVYSQLNGDTTERVYSYCFNLTDEKDNLILSSGWLLHNSNSDSEIYQSEDEFYTAKDLEINKSYYIQYQVRTNNMMEYGSPKYRLVERTSVNSEFNFTLEAVLNYDNGYVDLKLNGELDDSGAEKPVTGAFLISRFDKDKSEWEEFSRFVLASQLPSLKSWKDFTIEQGKEYTYSIQQYNDAGLYSNRILSNKIYADFEDAFLFDGYRQLKIKYNPKINTFKTDIQESKVDTIGSKYPFIFRNGRVSYKEFPISGLISYYTDEDKLFYDSIKDNIWTTDFFNYNIKAERDFKLFVLDWLNNGKPKIFRSPTEGNYIVRLMNVSLSPEDRLGRMLHNFNSTAYEIDDFNYSNLIKYNFIISSSQNLNNSNNIDLNPDSNKENQDYKTENDEFYFQWETKKIVDIIENNKVFNDYVLLGVVFQDILPGSYLYAVTDQGADYSNYDALEPYKIVIGATGSYKIDSSIPVYGIVLPDVDKETAIKQYGVGYINYGYKKEFEYSFNEIKDVEILEVPARQFVGENDIIKQIEYVPYNKPDGAIEYRKNPKIEIVEFYNITCYKRLIYDFPQTLIPRLDDVFALYRYKEGENSYYYDFYKNYEKLKYYYDNEELNIGLDSLIPEDKLSFEFYINDSNISVEDGQDFILNSPENVKNLFINNGVVAQVSYQIRNIGYLIEENNQIVAGKKALYLDTVKELKDLIESGHVDLEKENALRLSVDKTYNDFINTLIDEQLKAKEAGGLI